MSFRSSIIRSARSAARPTINRSNNVVGKRMASTGEHKSSGNMPWAIGSAAVFGSLVSHRANDDVRWRSGMAMGLARSVFVHMEMIAEFLF